MEDQHTWSAALFGNGQIAADRSAINLKCSHTALPKNARNTVLQEAAHTCSVPASLDTCEATVPSAIVSTGVNAGATHRSAHLFFHRKAKPVTKAKIREDKAAHQKQLRVPKSTRKAVKSFRIGPFW